MKKTRFILDVVSAFLALLSLVFFVLMAHYSKEEGENIPLLVTFLILGMVFSLISAFEKVFSSLPGGRIIVTISPLLAFLFAQISVALVISFRVSYLAFFFSGDVMGTGLSLFFLLGTFTLLSEVVFSLLSLIFQQKDTVQPERK